MRSLLILSLASSFAVPAFAEEPPPSSGVSDPQARWSAQMAALKDRPEELWAYINGLALELHGAGRYPDALEFAKVNLELARKIYPRTHPRMVATLANVGQMCISNARYEEGEPYLWEALSRALEVKRADQDLVTVANNLADCQAILGKYEEAIGIYEKALGMNQKLGHGDSPLQAVILDNLGQSLLSLGKHDEALEAFRAAIAINAKHLPIEHPSSTETIGHIAALHVVRGELDLAEAYYERLLKMTQSTHGKRHPNVAKSMRDLADAYSMKGRHDEADHLMHHALQIVEATFGEDHANLAGYLEVAGRVKLVRGDPKAAAGFFARALQAIDRASPDSVTAASIADNLASAELQLRQLDEAEMHASRALAVVEKRLPHGHPQHVTVLSTMAAVTFAGKKYREAVDLNRRLIALLEDDPALAEMLDSVYENQAIALRQLGLEGDAAEMDRKRMAFRGRNLPRS